MLLIFSIIFAKTEIYSTVENVELTDQINVATITAHCDSARNAVPSIHVNSLYISPLFHVSSLTSANQHSKHQQQTQIQRLLKALGMRFTLRVAQPETG